jgi:hypothetical protein
MEPTKLTTLRKVLMILGSLGVAVLSSGSWIVVRELYKEILTRQGNEIEIALALTFIAGLWVGYKILNK